VLDLARRPPLRSGLVAPGELDPAARSRAHRDSTALRA
jgi:hypothetical protein